MLAWGAGLWLGIAPLERFELNAESMLLGVVATLPMLAALWWTLTTRWGPARRLVDLVVEQLGPTLAERPAVQLALLATLAGLAEEILFRGVVQIKLAELMQEAWALVAASTLFGLAHFVSRAYAIFAGMVGLYLGWLFLVQGNLVIPIVAHALYDLVALICVAQKYRASIKPGHR